MAKRYRPFRRINLTAMAARKIREKLVDKTLEDHYSKCVPVKDEGYKDYESDCPHQFPGRSLDVARLVESGIEVGKKRGKLDVPCPYTTSDPKDHIAVLVKLADRLRSFGMTEPRNMAKAFSRAADEVDAYAHRTEMEVLAEQALG